MHQGLKITNKANNIIFDSAWILGVDYYEEIFEDDKYNKEEEDTNNTEKNSKITNTEK